MSFKQHLEQMSFDDLIPLWNECCAQYRQDDAIYDSIEVFAELYCEDGVELARKVFFGSVDNWYDKVYLDGYGNFQSCYSVESSPIDIDALADFMKDENHPDYVAWCDEQPTTVELMEIDYLNNTLEMYYQGRKIILQVNAQDGEDFELDAYFAEELKKQLQETIV